jgi:hypothetical protein
MKKAFSFLVLVLVFVLFPLVFCLGDNFIVEDAKNIKEPIFIDTISVTLGVTDVKEADFQSFSSTIYKKVEWKKISSILSGHGTPVVFEAAALTNIKNDTGGVDGKYSYTASDGYSGYQYALGGNLVHKKHVSFGNITLSVWINSDVDGIVATAKYTFWAMNTNISETVTINNNGDIFEDVKVKNLGEIISLISAKFPLKVAEDVKNTEVR